MTTKNYDNCRQCGQTKDIMHMIRIDRMRVHGPRKSSTTFGYFCSPACLEAWVIGSALSVGCRVESKGSIMRWPSSDEPANDPIADYLKATQEYGSDDSGDVPARLTP